MNYQLAYQQLNNLFHSISHLSQQDNNPTQQANLDLYFQMISSIATELNNQLQVINQQCLNTPAKRRQRFFESKSGEIQDICFLISFIFENIFQYKNQFNNFKEISSVLKFNLKTLLKEYKTAVKKKTNVSNDMIEAILNINITLIKNIVLKRDVFFATAIESLNYSHDFSADYNEQKSYHFKFRVHVLLTVLGDEKVKQYEKALYYFEKIKEKESALLSMTTLLMHLNKGIDNEKLRGGASSQEYITLKRDYERVLLTKEQQLESRTIDFSYIKECIVPHLQDMPFNYLFNDKNLTLTFFIPFDSANKQIFDSDPYIKYEVEKTSIVIENVSNLCPNKLFALFNQIKFSFKEKEGRELRKINLELTLASQKSVELEVVDNNNNQDSSKKDEAKTHHVNVSKQEQLSSSSSESESSSDSDQSEPEAVKYDDCNNNNKNVVVEKVGKASDFGFPEEFDKYDVAELSIKSLSKKCFYAIMKRNFSDKELKDKGVSKAVYEDYMATFKKGNIVKKRKSKGMAFRDLPYSVKYRSLNIVDNKKIECIETTNKTLKIKDPTKDPRLEAIPVYKVNGKILYKFCFWSKHKDSKEEIKKKIIQKSEKAASRLRR